jgi:hypothetical protein
VLETLFAWPLLEDFLRTPAQSAWAGRNLGVESHRQEYLTALASLHDDQDALTDLLGEIRLALTAVGAERQGSIDAYLDHAREQIARVSDSLFRDAHDDWTSAGFLGSLAWLDGLFQATARIRGLTSARAIVEESQTFSDGELDFNIPPIAENDEFEAIYNSVNYIPPRGVLLNDWDFDGPPENLTATLTMDAAHGTVDLAPDGSFVYTPDDDFVGTDQFQYRAFDGIDYSSNAVVTLAVYPPVVFLDGDSNNDGTIDFGDDPFEDTNPGQMLRYNDNDDNDNWTPDYDDTGFADSDLVPIQLDYRPYYINQGCGLDGYTLSLDETESQGRLRLWETPDKTSPARSTYTIGVDPLPMTIYAEGIGPGVARLGLVMRNTAGRELARDTDTFTVIRLDLDVNNDMGVDGPCDGVRNYLPGYCGTTPVLSSGTSYNTQVYTPQEMHLVANVGLNDGISAVHFHLGFPSSHPGYAENKSDPSIEAPGNQWDYSFAPDVDLGDAAGVVSSFKTWTAFYAKDYGGTGTIQAVFHQAGGGYLIYYLTVPFDRDSDGLADSWERQKVTEWNQQFAKSQPVDNRFFGREDDKEERDPDAAANTDGGTNMPEHKAAGDSLTAFQEYRGFIVDGGHGSFAGGHTRLSPSHKELLIETDRMTQVLHMPSVDDLKSILNNVVAGFEDATSGAGIRVYWVLDQEEASPHMVFQSDDEATDWARWTAGRSLGAFVHLMFTDTFAPLPTLEGHAGVGGGFVHVRAVKDASTQEGYAYHEGLTTVATHEITHLLLDELNVPPFEETEHLLDPDEDGIERGPGDRKYLMYIDKTPENRTAVNFSMPTRRALDLTNKESVERPW